MTTTTREQGHTRNNPCAVCNGFDQAPRGKGVRCHGFRSDDGNYAHCSREEYAGRLAINPNSSTYPHRLTGDCRCGNRHNPHRDPAQARKQKRSGGLGEIVDVYLYDDTPTPYEVVRYEPKDFRQRRVLGDGKWEWNMDGVTLCLFRQRELREAPKDEVVLKAEGEKAVMELCSRGYLATCSPGGAGKWRPDGRDPARQRRQGQA